MGLHFTRTHVETGDSSKLNGQWASIFTPINLIGLINKWASPSALSNSPNQSTYFISHSTL